VLAYDALADRESQPGALAFALGGEKRLEDLRRQRLRHARPIVDEIDRHAVQPTPGPHDDGARPAGGRDGLGGIVDQIDEDLLNLVRLDVRHRQVRLHVNARLHPVGHELVAQQEEGRVQQGTERGGPPLVLVLAREAQQVLHDVGRPLGLLLDHREWLTQGRRHVGDFHQIIGKSYHRRERVVEVVGDAGDELPDGGHLLRLDELVLQAAPFGLIIKEEHDGRAVGTADRHRGHRVGPLPGPELDFAARSLLIQCPLQIRGPFRRNEGLPGPADQAGRRSVHQVRERPVGPPDPAAPVHDADRRRDGVHHLLPGPSAVIVEIHQASALQRDAGLGDEAFQEREVGGAVATRLTAGGDRAGYPSPSEERHDQPTSPGVRLRLEAAVLECRAGAVGQHQRASPGGEIQQGPAVG
jgi:hypothetical protein